MRRLKASEKECKNTSAMAGLSLGAAGRRCRSSGCLGAGVGLGGEGEVIRRVCRMRALGRVGRRDMVTGMVGVLGVDRQEGLLVTSQYIVRGSFCNHLFRENLHDVEISRGWNHSEAVPRPFVLRFCCYIRLLACLPSRANVPEQRVPIFLQSHLFQWGKSLRWEMPADHPPRLELGQ